MKKVTLLIIGIGSLVATSCSKNKKDLQPPPPTAPTTAKNASVNDQSTVFGTDKLIGSYEHNTGGREIQIRSDFTITGTVPLSKIKNIYFITRKKDSSIIYRSSKNPYTIAFNQTTTWITLPKGTGYSTTLYADIDSGATGTIVTKIHTQFRATDTTGWMDEVTGQTITMQLYKSSPTVSSIGTSIKVANGDFVVMNSTKVQSSPFDPTAVKQNSYQATFANNSGAGNMRFDSMRVFFNDVDLTGKAILVDDAGTTITSISQNSAVKIFHAVMITGDGDWVIPLGTEGVITLKGLVRGFGGDSVISDVATITAIKDAAAVPAGYTYLNKGTAGWHAKLYNSWLPNSSAKPANFVWSPMSYQPFDPNYGSPVPNWFNSFGISFTATPFIFHS